MNLPFPSKRAPAFADIPDEKWNDWRWQLSHRLNSAEEIEKIIPLNESERKALNADRLFRVDNPSSEEGDFKDYINPDSLQIVRNAWLEPTMAQAKPGEYYQFIRKGYFTVDSKLSSAGQPVFNRTVTLKDNWEKQKSK